MCFCFTKTLAGGAIPRTPSTTSAPERGTARLRSSSVARWRRYRWASAVSRPRAEMLDRQPVGEQLLCRLGAALNPFPEGSLVRERPGGAGGMSLHMPNSPYAAPGIPKGRVAPVHGPQTRIGTGDPRAVAQPEAVRRLAEPTSRTPKRNFPAQAPRCRIHTSGSATGSAPGAPIRTPSRWLERHVEWPSITSPIDTSAPSSCVQDARIGAAPSSRRGGDPIANRPTPTLLDHPTGARTHARADGLPPPH